MSDDLDGASMVETLPFKMTYMASSLPYLVTFLAMPRDFLEV